ncbi:putative transporter [Vibrio halioticoli NBRC 102217]|uniref:Putative transporter n=1 Tax=Vibrio halioticoli NBRC 102217 TaxID=1219072 RepID=V5FLV7_9VIBR|nr:GntP family permease [Vibrio halioticoli]GAD90646.1 putative transporter [Vibrio halioticoli NBRC 102217]
MEVNLFGTVVALALAIVLILRKYPPAYGMLVGAAVGGLVGGLGLGNTVSVMIDGAQGIMPAVLRICAAGVLAGMLIESGAASRIANTIIEKFGDRYALLAIGLSVTILTTVGVFVDISVITVAPVALTIGKRLGYRRVGVLLMMIGCGHAGNICSANPNAIAIADAFNLSLTSVMAAGIIPAIVGIIFCYFVASHLNKKGAPDLIDDTFFESQTEDSDLPSFISSILGPIVSILLLALRPIAGINIDPLIALPVGGVAGAIAMGKAKEIRHFSTQGLLKMGPVCIMLLGTGALAGIITVSTLKGDLLAMIDMFGLPTYILAPISGALMSFATASTTAGAAVASNVFGPSLISYGVSGLSAGAMIHAGATVLGDMPHGSFFHSSAGAVNMQITERLKVLPYEIAAGAVLAITSTLVFGVFSIL